MAKRSKTGGMATVAPPPSTTVAAPGYTPVAAPAGLPKPLPYVAVGAYGTTPNAGPLGIGARPNTKNGAVLAALTATPQTMAALVAAAAAANPAICFAGRTFYNLCNGLYRCNRLGKSALGFYLLPALPAPVGPAATQAPVSA